MTSISVIVPTFNRAAFLVEALKGIARQSRPVAEIIVWDDGSTDGTAEAVRAAGVHARYFRAENAGKSRALNRALEEASGDYVWICDDDDIALPHAAETLGRLLDAEPQLGIAGASYRRFTETAGRVAEQGPGYWPDLSTGTPIRHLLEDIFLFQNATLVRRELYRRAGPFREDLARSIDYDMIVRLGLLAPIQVLDEPVFLQRKHDGDRGPAAARHAAAQSNIVWKGMDRAVFAALRNKLSVPFFEAMFEADDARTVRRAALLQRACVFARRTDWDSALDDLQAAAGAAPDLLLSGLERQICRRALAGKHGADGILAPGIRVCLSAMVRSDGAGREIGRALSRGLVWRVREAVAQRAVAPAAAFAVLAARLAHPLGPRAKANRPVRIAERKALPQSAYLAVSRPNSA